MTFWEWLSTPAGVDLVHAIIGLLIAITGVIAYQSHRVIAENATKLDRHIESHRILDTQPDLSQISTPPQPPSQPGGVS